MTSKSADQVIYARTALSADRLWMPLVHPSVPYGLRLAVRDLLAVRPQEVDGEIDEDGTRWAWVRVVWQTDRLSPCAWTVHRKNEQGHLTVRRRGGPSSTHYWQACFFGSPASAQRYASPGDEIAPAFGEPWELVEDFWARAPALVQDAKGAMWSVRKRDIGYDVRPDGHAVLVSPQRASGRWVWDGGEVDLGPAERTPLSERLVQLDRTLRRAMYETWIADPGWGAILGR